MEYLFDFFNKLLASFESTRLIFLVLIGITVGLFTLIVSSIYSASRNPVRRRVNVMSDVAADRQSERFDSFIDSASPYVLPTKGKELSKTKEQLIHAGLRNPQAPTVFFLSKFILGLLFLLIVIFAARFYPVFSTYHVIFAALAAGFIGMLIPNYVLRKLYMDRQTALRKAFPDALDLLVVCVESGLGLNAAIQRVGKELTVSHPVLAEEFTIVNEEIRAGVPRNVALHNLADRTGLDDIKGLVSTLSQSQRLGTSISESLRVYSEEFRDKQMQRAEEIAAKIPTKLIFPLVFCIFPAFFVISVGPAVIAIIKVFSEIK